MSTVSKSVFVIAVPNLNASAAFYRDVLGFSIDTLADAGWLVYSFGACTMMAGECSNAIPPSELGDHSYLPTWKWTTFSRTMNRYAPQEQSFASRCAMKIGV